MDHNDIENELFSYAETGDGAGAQDNDNHDQSQQTQTREDNSSSSEIEDNGGASFGQSQKDQPTGQGNGQVSQGDQAQQGQDSIGQEPQGSVRVDQKGNLVDQQGNIIATAGAQRRWYQTMERTRRENETLRSQLNEARNLNGKYGELAQEVQRHNLTPEQARSAMYMYGEFQRDPTNVVKTLLTELAARGINTSELLGAQQGQIDMAGIQQMINNAISPLVQDRQTREEQLRIENDVARQVDQFFSEFPDARTHEDALARLVTADPNLTLERAYVKLYQWAHQNGLDFSKPLGPQFQQGATAQTQQHNQQTHSNVTQTQRPIPRGNASVNETVGDEGIYADPTRSMKDIIAEAMRAEGLDPNRY